MTGLTEPASDLPSEVEFEIHRIAFMVCETAFGLTGCACKREGAAPCRRSINDAITVLGAVGLTALELAALRRG